MEDDASHFSVRRLDNIKRNRALLDELGAFAQAQVIQGSAVRSEVKTQDRTAKRKRVDKPKSKDTPRRTSARIAAAPTRPSYNEDGGTTRRDEVPSRTARMKSNNQTGHLSRSSSMNYKDTGDEEAEPAPDLKLNELNELQGSWSSWTPSASPPIRDESGTLHFESHPDFTPNKSPAEVLREGAFGGSYFRPLYSKKLGITISDDYLELPASWIEGLNIPHYLTSPVYDPEANKFKVACGQSIEQWEANGWIEHRFDVRGWFQWYCRFFEGRRCDDDERQVSRWKKCVGHTGRWRRMLLKKYLNSGVRTVWDDGEDEDAPEVSPVMHQTCHHWAFEVTQGVLDDYWRTGK